MPEMSRPDRDGFWWFHEADTKLLICKVDIGLNSAQFIGSKYRFFLDELNGKFYWAEPPCITSEK